MTHSEMFKIIQSEVLSLGADWSIRHSDDDTLYFAYAGKSGLATCCLFFIFWPIALIYALMGISGGKAMVNGKLVGDKIHVSGNPTYTITVYNKLRSNPQIGKHVEQTKFIIQILQGRRIAHVVTVLVILMIIVTIAIANSR